MAEVSERKWQPTQVLTDDEFYSDKVQEYLKGLEDYTDLKYTINNETRHQILLPFVPKKRG